MAIITISRGTFSGGRQLATCLAANLGYRIISREVLVEAAQRYGVREEDLARGIEQPPSFWDRFRIDRQLYMAAISAALARAVRDGDVVYHGNAGHLLLSGIEFAMRVRVIAPMEFRIKEAIAAHGFDRREAESYINSKDAERVAWTRFLYGVEWRDPSLYDLVVNLEKVTVEAACQTIACLVERPEFRMSPEGTGALDDLFLTNHVKVKLFQNPRIAAAATKITVASKAGVVSLAGMLPGEGVREEALATVRALEEVKEVQGTGHRPQVVLPPLRSPAGIQGRGVGVEG
jgi:cytidylate kinase